MIYYYNSGLYLIYALKDEFYLQKCFLTFFSLGAAGENILHIGNFLDSFAESVFIKWMKMTNKKLTNYQWRVVLNASSKCSSPLFCSIAFTEFSRWRSYHEKEQTILSNTLESIISQLLSGLESKFDRTLVEHSLAYIAASKHGLSEAELEDVLSLDDIVLSSIFSHQVSFFFQPAWLSVITTKD